MKKVLAISSVLLGVVFLAGCSQQPVSQTQPTVPAPVAQQPATNQPVATQPTQPTTENKTVDLKSYTNDKYGFEIKYPSDWTFQSTADGKFAIKSPGEVSPVLNISFLAEKYSDILSSEQVKFNKLLKESIEKPGGVVNDVSLDGKPAKEFLYYSPIGSTDQVIIATNNGYTIKINSFKNSILDSVLSTFKLTK